MPNKLRSSLFQDDFGSKVQERLSNVENHEQGNKVQFIYTNGNGTSSGSGQFWPLVGKGTFGGITSEFDVPLYVNVPADVVVNSAVISVELTSTEFFTGPSTASFRTAQVLRFDMPSYWNNIFVYPYVSEAYQDSQVGLPAQSIMPAVFPGIVEGTWWVPTQGTQFPQYLVGDLTDYLVPGTEQLFYLFPETPKPDGYFGLVNIRLIVNGYTKNR